MTEPSTETGADGASEGDRQITGAGCAVQDLISLLRIRPARGSAPPAMMDAGGQNRVGPVVARRDRGEHRADLRRIGPVSCWVACHAGIVTTL